MVSARPTPPSRTPEPPHAALLKRIQGEFLEMPGLRLTTNQAARLWDVELSTASSLLQALADCRFLELKDGKYARTAS